MLPEDTTAERVDLAERDGLETARALKTEAEATDAAEQVKDAKLFHHCTPARSRTSTRSSPAMKIGKTRIGWRSMSAGLRDIDVGPQSIARNAKLGLDAKRHGRRRLPTTLLKVMDVASARPQLLGEGLMREAMRLAISDKVFHARQFRT